jgi:MFS family permease
VLGRSGQNAAQTTFPLIGKDLLGLSSTVLGVVVAAAGLAGVLCSTLVVGRQPAHRSLTLVAMGQGLGLLAFVVFALPTGTTGLVTGALALGAGGGLIFPALMTTVGGSGRSPLRAKALAVFGVALSTSLVVGPLIEAGVLHLMHGSLRGTFAALVPLPAGATLLAARAAIVTRSRVPRRAGQSIATGPGPGAGPGTCAAGTEATAAKCTGSAAPGPLRVAPASEPPAIPGGPAVDAAVDRFDGQVPRAASEGGASSEGPREPSPSVAPLWRQPAFRIATATMLTYQVPFVALVAFGGVLARRVDHASAADVEVAFGVFFALSLAVRAALAWRIHGAGGRRILKGAVAATVLGVAIIGSVHSYPLLLVGMAVLGVPHGTTFPMASALLAERTPASALPRSNGRLMAVTNGATIAVPFVAGVLASAFGYGTMFLLLEVPVVLLGGLLISQLGTLEAPAGVP